MKTVIILKANIICSPGLSIAVDHNFRSGKELCAFLQMVSPRFIVESRPYYKGMDGECVDISTVVRQVQNATITYVDKYNHKEIDTWHLVEDGEFDYNKFKRGKCKVSEGKLYQLKKHFVPCPIKYTLRNVAAGSWKAMEALEL